MPDLRQGSGSDAANDAAHQGLPPENSPAVQQAAHQADIALAILAVSRPLDNTSRLLSISALVLLVWHPGGPAVWAALALSIVFGIAECGFALRCAFDIPIFTSWARRWHQGHPPQDDLAAFDLALADSGLGPKASAVPRPLAQRIAGVRRLVKNQVRCLALQGAAWVATLALLFLS
ncbi:hypothetical protein [Herbaspirillum huttiense]|uniref:hypothetical protein n=1 Tax=Herbaspirillum huttiense TaxID=863372 RepID=UPI0039AFCA2A